MAPQPSIGRIVWFYPSAPTPIAQGLLQPHAATIAYVHGPALVNLAVVDGNGNPYNATSVPLYHPEQVPEVATGYYATWMPYQCGAPDVAGAKGAKPATEGSDQPGPAA